MVYTLFITAAVVVYSSALAYSQSTQKPNKQVLSKIDAQLRMYTVHPEMLPNVGTTPSTNAMPAIPVVSVLFKSSAKDVKLLVEQNGGVLHSVIGPICTADLPINRIIEFAANAEVSRIELAQTVRPHNNQGRITIGAEKVSSGQLPGGTAYTGKGVIVGVVDTGLDFLHPDFRSKDDSTKSRVLAIWDQTVQTGVKPEGFTYGSVWTAEQIQQDISTGSEVVTERDSSGHGTHVMGTAAGVRGVAYNADLIAVKTPLVGNGDYTFTNSAKTLDAINYVYKHAEALQKPAVVNLSLGFVFGAPHDGTSLFEQGIDYLVTNRPGFIVCASAGNEGNSFSHHGGYTMNNDSVWTYINTLNGATWYGVNDVQYDEELSIAVAIDTARASFRGQGIIAQNEVLRSPFYKISELKDSLGGLHFALKNEKGDTTCTLSVIASAYDSNRTEWYIRARDRFVLTTDSATAPVHLYKIIFKGSGTFHAWTQALNGFAINLPPFGAKTNASFKASDNVMCIGIPATGKKTLAVGAYINKRDYIDIKGRTQAGLNSSGFAAGFRAGFSSIGPTLDNRNKPEITAPGLNVVSSHSRYADTDSSSLVDTHTAVFSGTSMSCPFTAGAVALYLEKNPTATFETLLTDITTQAIRDKFVSAVLPNNLWGYGKLDIFAAMGGVTGVEDGTLDYTTGLVWPSPTNSSVSIKLPTTDLFHTVRITNAAGTLVLESSLVNAIANNHIENSISVNVASWTPGVYFYQLAGKTNLVCGKFVVFE